MRHFVFILSYLLCSVDYILNVASDISTDTVIGIYFLQLHSCRELFMLNHMSSEIWQYKHTNYMFPLYKNGIIGIFWALSVPHPPHITVSISSSWSCLSSAYGTSIVTRTDRRPVCSAHTHTHIHTVLSAGTSFHSFDMRLTNGF